MTIIDEHFFLERLAFSAAELDDLCWLNPPIVSELWTIEDWAEA